MSLSIRLRPLAQDELASAIAWYEAASAGLGAAFGGAVFRILDTAAATPLIFPVADGEIREAAVTGYPYCAYYRVRGNLLIVVAIYHQSRDPSGWRGRA